MKRAWQIYKTVYGDRVAKLSYALKQAWAEFKEWEEKTFIQKAEAIGCRRWTKYGKDRLYLNSYIAKSYGLSYTVRKTGSLDKTTFDGDYISHSQAGRVLGELDGLYIDLAAGETAFNTANLRQPETKIIVERINKDIA